MTHICVVALQKHNAAREVFLTQMVDNNDVQSLWRPAQVCLPDAFEKAEGDDVFFCEYEYHTVCRVRSHGPSVSIRPLNSTPSARQLGSELMSRAE